MKPWGGLLFGQLFGLFFGLVLAGCPKDDTLVINFDQEPDKQQVAPSGEKVNFERPPVHKAGVENVHQPEKLDPSKLPTVKRETVEDPHKNVPNYKELGEEHKRA